MQTLTTLWGFNKHKSARNDSSIRVYVWQLATECYVCPSFQFVKVDGGKMWRRKWAYGPGSTLKLQNECLSFLLMFFFSCFFLYINGTPEITDGKKILMYSRCKSRSWQGLRPTTKIHEVMTVCPVTHDLWKSKYHNSIQPFILLNTHRLILILVY